MAEGGSQLPPLWVFLGSLSCTTPHPNMEIAIKQGQT